MFESKFFDGDLIISFFLSIFFIHPIKLSKKKHSETQPIYV